MSTPLARYGPYAVMTLLILIWGGSYVVVKLALVSLTPFALVAVRFWLALLCVLPFVRWRAPGELRAALRPGLIAGSALGLGYLLQTAGMDETTASTGGLLAGLIVPLVALGGFLWFSTRMGPRSVTGLLLAIVGIVAICMPAEAEPGAARDTLRGVLLQVASSTSYAVHVLLLSWFGRRVPVAAFTFWQLLFVALAGTATTWVAGHDLAPGGGPVQWTPALIGLVAYLGVLASALGIGVQGKVQHRVPPTPLALLYALQPLFAAVFGWTLLAEPWSTSQLVGGALIVLGVIVTSLERPAPARAATAPAAQ
jgi:drug/metabolite transporter (DMT)-like permease